MNESLRALIAGGAVSAGLAAIAWIADHRRIRRRNPDKVGFMPWTTIFVIGMFCAVLLFAAAIRVAAGG